MKNIIERILETLTLKLIDQFPNIETYSTDIHKGYESPCFFIEISNLKTEKINYKVDNLCMKIEIIYSCEDRNINQYEILNISDTLRKIFIDKYLQIDDDISVHILEDSLDIEEDNLTLSINIDLLLINDNNDLEYMEELNLT